MKRYGKKTIIEHIRNNGVIRYNEWFTLNAGYRVMSRDGEEILGYITQDLFSDLLNNREIVRSKAGYHYTDYRINPIGR